VLRSVRGVLALFLSAAPGHAQDWPAQPITIYMGFPAGSGVDMVAAMLQPSLEASLGQRAW
jgi:tripartite-type tricarboxylate transporter receptor subunit TctC